MNKSRYLAIRRSVRDNGARYALRFVSPEERAAFTFLEDQGNDYLRMRARLEPHNVKVRIALWPAVGESALTRAVVTRAAQSLNRQS